MTLGHRRPERAFWDDEAVDAAAELVLELTDRARETIAPRISHLQLRALIAVDRNSELNLAGLAELLTTGMSSTSRLCDRLEAAGLIERGTRADNRREVVLNLTRDGHRLLGRIRDLRRAAVADAVAALGASSVDSPAVTSYPNRLLA